MKNIFVVLIALTFTLSSCAQSSKKVRSNKVLLITSAQVDLLSENGKAWGFTEASEAQNKVRQNLVKILAQAREMNIPVIHSPVGFDYEKMKGFSPLNPIQGVIVENKLLEMNSPGIEFIPEALPREGETVLPYRQGFSSFWAKSIQGELKKIGADTIYIAGMLAEGCIQSHVRDAAENGYATVVISDAVGSTSLELLDASFKTLPLHTSEIITAEDFIQRF